MCMYSFEKNAYSISQEPRLKQDQIKDKNHNRVSNNKTANPSQITIKETDVSFSPQTTHSEKLKQKGCNPYNDRQDNPEQSRRMPNDPPSYSTWIMAFATFILAVFAGIQLLISRNSARRELRAYVFVEEVTIKNSIDPVKKPSITMSIKNYGQTPASNMIAVGTLAVHEYPLVSKLLQGPAGKGPISRFSIASNGSVYQEISLNRTLKPEEVEGLQGGNMAIYLFGNISYADVFKVKRSTNYRFMYNSYTGKVGTDTAMVACEYGNEAD